MNNRMTPIGTATLGEETRIEVELDKDAHIHGKDLCRRTMKDELRTRGLLCGGLKAELSERLEKDDKFQVGARTAEDYDTMNPKDIHGLCVRRFIPTNGTDSMLRDRLKNHDKRRGGREAVGPKPTALLLPGWPVSAPQNKGSRELLREKPLVVIVKEGPIQHTELQNGMLHGRNRKIACDRCRKKKRLCVHRRNGNDETAKTVNDRRTPCDECRKRKRRCDHGRNGNGNPAKAIEPVMPKTTGCKAFIKDKTGLMARNPARVIEESSEIHVTMSGSSTATATASQGDLSSLARTEKIGKGVKKKANMPKSRRAQLLYQPKDEIILLQICIELKDVIGWGNISGFWTMVQETLELKTGKPHQRVGRHVRLLVRKRLAEQDEIQEKGEVSFSRVSAQCRPLLDKWMAGGNRVHPASPNNPATPGSNEIENDVSLDEYESQQLDSGNTALEMQKRSATDAWLDASSDRKHCKQIKLSTSERYNDISKASDDSTGWWSLSGSSVTSDTSVEYESEAESDADVKREYLGENSATKELASHYPAYE